MSGWGHVDETEIPSPILLTANLTFSNYSKCLELFSVENREKIYKDKICGGRGTGEFNINIRISFSRRIS